MRGSEWVELIFYVGALGAFGVATVTAAYRAFRLKPLHAVLARIGAHWDTREHGTLQTPGGHRVVLRALYNDNGQLRALRLQWPRQIGTALTLGPPGRMADTGFPTGDARFDEEVHAEATDDLLAWSVLSDDARSAIRKAVGHGGRFADHAWGLDGRSVDAEQLEQAVLRVDKACTATTPPETAAEVTRRVAARARMDPDPDVRLLALQVLVRRQLADDRLLEECERAPQPAMKLEAARARGEAGRATLRTLLTRGSVTFRVGAAVALVAAGPRDDLAAIEDALVGALGDARFADQAARLLADVGTPRILPALGAVTDGPGAGPAAQARAAIVGRTDPSLAGAVSLADGGRGELALAEPPRRAGDVSVAEGATDP